MAPIESFEHGSTAGRIAFGCGTIGDFGATFAALDADRALVVCGSNVGANRRLMDSQVRRARGSLRPATTYGC